MIETLLSPLSIVNSAGLKVVAKDSSTSTLKKEEISTINDLLVARARTMPEEPLVGYPASLRGRSDYVYYTARDLDRFADEAAKNLAGMGLTSSQITGSHDAQDKVIAILAPSTLDYVTSLFALSRMGFTVLLLSNRLATEAYISLLQKTNCHDILGSPSTSKSIAAIQANWPLNLYQMPEKFTYDLQIPSGPPFQELSHSSMASKRTAFIIHSSGSTGLPKPIFQSHSACLANYSSGTGYRAFLTLPLYHNHGLSTFFRAIYSGTPIAMFNASLPLSGSNLVEAIESVQPQSFHGVPYALKLLAESERGIAALKTCKLVLFGGSSCPDELGDRLVAAGVYIVGHYGATEMGQLMTSFRHLDDKAWNYLRPLPSVEQYIYMQPQGENIFECVVLDGLPAKVVSNSADPPNSFHTSDTFVPHPTIANAWKYLGRLDDRVTLFNGEKVLPVPFEHHVRQNELVRDACVFGIGKSIPGILIIPSEKAAGLKKDETLQKIWPSIEAANTRVEGFGRISREMVEILDIGVEYPCTDKGTMIRAASYVKFADLIEMVYERFERGADECSDEKLTLTLLELQAYLIQVFSERFGLEHITDTTDFFDAGVDSLQAITLWGLLKRQLNLGNSQLGQNVVFEFPNVKQLARHLFALQTNQDIVQEDELDVMAELIQKYSKFERHVPGTDVVDGEVVLLTGTTGSLGAHILSQILEKEHVKEVYCLVRASSICAAKDRVLSTLAAKKINYSSNSDKIIALPADLSRPDLGLNIEILRGLKRKLTKVIHSAWAVNFNLGVRSFEQQHIRGVSNLINLCLGVGTAIPAQFFFCSSISAAAGTPLPAVIEETHITKLAYAQKMGYARSKLVTERIVRAAVEQTEMVAKVLRVGQIVGDCENGIWNNTEAIPLMIRSAVTTGALPALDETPSWLPVDV